MFGTFNRVVCFGIDVPPEGDVWSRDGSDREESHMKNWIELYINEWTECYGVWWNLLNGCTNYDYIDNQSRKWEYQVFHRKQIICIQHRHHSEFANMFSVGWSCDAFFFFFWIRISSWICLEFGAIVLRSLPVTTKL